MIEVPRERPVTFAQFVRKTRENSGQSMRSTAKRVGVSSSFLSDVELGYRMPSAEVLTKLASVLEVPESEFLKFDPRQHIKALNQKLETTPELAVLFARLAERYRDGKISYQELVQIVR